MLTNHNISFERISELLKTTEQISRMHDVDSLLDTILSEARRFTNADAGSIFLKKGDQLEFSYIQNATLAKREKNANKHVYSSFSIPITEESIAGYVALTGRLVLIDDVYKIDKTFPYKFNKKFDILSSYRTQSMLTLPLKLNDSEVIGVIQILNHLDEKGNVSPFSMEDEEYVSFFANNAALAIEKARMTRETILRMIKMAELRDPKETGAHVNRVACYAIEIYDVWAKKRGLREERIKKDKDTLRIAAMLHDVGKIAISDTILKKPDKLTDKEYKIMQSHVSLGKSLFDNSMTSFDNMSAEIAHTHHEKWDGSGYPRGLEGEAIPIYGRITALADVYDALSSNRSYKKSWDEAEVLKYIKEASGKHFDPELVGIFISIYDIIKAIREKYPDKE